MSYTHKISKVLYKTFACGKIFKYSNSARQYVEDDNPTIQQLTQTR